jgi:hypothetical protein
VVERKAKRGLTLGRLVPLEGMELDTVVSGEVEKRGWQETRLLFFYTRVLLFFPRFFWFVFWGSIATRCGHVAGSVQIKIGSLLTESSQRLFRSVLELVRDTENTVLDVIRAACHTQTKAVEAPGGVQVHPFDSPSGCSSTWDLGGQLRGAEAPARVLDGVRMPRSQQQSGRVLLHRRGGRKSPRQEFAPIRWPRIHSVHGCD